MLSRCACFMPSSKFLVIAFAAVLLTGSLSAQSTIWDESIQGDLPANLGPIYAGSNLVAGVVGLGASGDALVDKDVVKFTIPSGFFLKNFVVTAVTSKALAFSLDTVTPTATNSLAFHIFQSYNFDLLLLAQPYGSQPAGNYQFSVTTALNDISARNYNLDLVVASVPEPASIWLFASALPVACLVYRRIFPPPVPSPAR